MGKYMQMPRSAQHQVFILQVLCSLMAVVCVLVTVVTMTKSTCIKASAHHVHGRDHGSTQADMVLEK